MQFKNFEDVQQFLEDLDQSHIDLGLERMEKGLAALGLYDRPYKAVQVVGTNGKGSTVTFLASLAQAHGLKVGLYTSPHFITPRERIKINGAMLSPEAWRDYMGHVVSTVGSATYFELLTLFAVYAFVASGVDLMVLEAGLGGKYDATTAVPVDLVCYAPISLDHEKFLGETVEEIALEKSQAIRSGKLVLTGPQEGSVLTILNRTAKEKNASFYSVSRLTLPCDVASFDYAFNDGPAKTGSDVNADLNSKPKLGLLGKFQAMNANLALGAWSILSERHKWRSDLPSICRGLSQAHIPGRFHYVKPRLKRRNLPIILDGAHNPGALEVFCSELQNFGITPGAIVFSCFADKNVRRMVEIVEKIAGGAPVLTPTIQCHDRAIDSQELAGYFTRVQSIPVQRLSLALTYLMEASVEFTARNPIVIVGSLYLLGEFFTLYPDSLDL